MTPLDELINHALADEAATHDQLADLAFRSIKSGRAFRRRRRVAMVSAVVASCAALVSGSIVIAESVGSRDQVLQTKPAGQPSGHASRSGHQAAGQVHSVPPWSSWPADRVFGTKPSAAFLSDVPVDATLLASGTMPDGMDFRIASLPHSQQPIDDLYGFGNERIFGDEPATGSPEYRPRAPYFAMLTMTAGTWDHGQEDGNDGFWLIVVGQPDTTTAAYSADGQAWQPMQLQQGIAVLKLDDPTAAIPQTARLRLADLKGTYADGPLDLL